MLVGVMVASTVLQMAVSMVATLVDKLDESLAGN